MRKLCILMMTLLAAGPLFAGLRCEGRWILVQSGTITLADLQTVPQQTPTGAWLSTWDRAALVAENIRLAYQGSQNILTKVQTRPSMMRDPLNPYNWIPNPGGPWTYKILRCYGRGEFPMYPHEKSTDFAREVMKGAVGAIGGGIGHTDGRVVSAEGIEGSKFYLVADLVDEGGNTKGSITVDMEFMEVTELIME
ncbi:hypothetical protein SCOR_05215 [Sulfidibacter corallicola]|uniref:Uncharacterized protein n=1 Tax=Sulfidibacter corallicola TaxID=2818388 RepID=A0A8A4TQY7_SULCO|nr:hypothetical protein [Sulfidibacter corallicola]QTD51827.1 hypothetical protein J3U87_05095 [Sulfidibacter corallicola]